MDYSESRIKIFGELTNQMSELTPPGNYTYRPITTADLRGIIYMTAAAVDIDRTEGPATEENLMQIYNILGENIGTNTLAAIGEDGEIAALALVIVRPGEGELLASLDGSVHVKHRGKGLGSYILHWMEHRAQDEWRASGWNLPLVLRTSCTDHLEDRINLFEQNGYQAARYAYKMQRDLAEPIPPVALPGSLRMVAWSKERDEQLRQAFNTAFKGSWGVPEIDEQLWPQIFTGIPKFRGDLSFLVQDGEKILGFCINWIDEAKNRQRDVKEGWIEALGVIPERRGMGIASALLSHSLEEFKASGLEQAALDVDTQNPTGALRLYENLGFIAIKRTITFVKTNR
jgi:ribosomal protein S18 acetylase RimI-like enzyme